MKFSKRQLLYDIDEILNQGPVRHSGGGRFWYGLAAGIVLVLLLAGGYRFGGASRFCGACHSMETEYTQWKLSRHKQFACIECHMPNTNIAGKLAYKTRAGLNDFWHEVTRNYPAHIRLSSKGKDIMNGNCFRCHFSTIENTCMSGGGQNCLKCHHNLVHGQDIMKGGLKYE
ncbi:MAG: NapC/NirT family cytochrome c [Deltaproteobacteria bacterium]